MNETHTIYIILSMSGTKFSRLLRLFSHLEFTHVSLSLVNDLSTMYSFGRRRLRMPWIAGFVEEHPDMGVFGAYNPDCEVLALQVSAENYNKIVEDIKFAKEHYNSFKYNYPALFFTYFNRPMNLKNKFTCTQYVAYLLNNSRSVEFDKDVSLVIPSDYYKLPASSVYKGKMHNFTSKCMSAKGVRL